MRILGKKIGSLLLTAALAAAVCAVPVSAKTVAVDMMGKGWSEESTMTPSKTADGWQLRSSPTMDGGNAVTYFDLKYHKGQMIAYDFTAEGDEVTINIGFIRDLEESVYPNGEREFIFTKHLAKSLGIEGTGEMEATIPGGTYKGVLDPGDFFYEGFDKFQHVAFYLGGESLTVREFAFVEGVKPGAETYPKPKPTQTEGTTAAPPVVTPDPDTPNQPDEPNTPNQPDSSTKAESQAGESQANSASSKPSEDASQAGLPIVAVVLITVAATLAAAGIVIAAVVLIKKKKKTP